MSTSSHTPPRTSSDCCETRPRPGSRMPCARSRYPDGVSASTPGQTSGRRSIVLGVVIFAATLLLLFGALNLTRRAGPAAAAGSPSQGAERTGTGSTRPGESDAPATASPSAASASASPSASPVTDAVLSGAGDIASCSSGADKKTAALVDAIPGTVF